MIAKPAQQPANTQVHYEVTGRDLPVSCPGKHMALWNSHPRVYLDLSKGWAKCGYCGAEYTLKR